MPSNTKHHHLWWFQEQQSPGLLVLNYLFFSDHSFYLTSGHVCYTVITDSYKCCHILQLQTSHFPSLSVSFLLIPSNTQLQLFNLTKTYNPVSLPPILFLTPHMTSLPYLIRLESKVHHYNVSSCTELLLPCISCYLSPFVTTLVKPNHACMQLNRRDTQPCSPVSLQNLLPHVPFNTEEQSY